MDFQVSKSESQNRSHGKIAPPRKKHSPQKFYTCKLSQISLAEQFYSTAGENFEEIIEKIAFLRKNRYFHHQLYIQTLAGSSPSITPRKNRCPSEGSDPQLPHCGGELTAHHTYDENQQT